MARAIDKRIMLDLIIEAKKTNPETGSFSEWLAEYLVDHLPTLTQPNEPLTIEELREMDGEPVWVELHQAWALVEVKQNGSVMFYGNSFSCSYSRTWQVYRFRPYRRPPEGET